MQSDLEEALREGFAGFLEVSGQEEISIEGIPGTLQASWSALGRSESFESAGRRLSFSETIEFLATPATLLLRNGVRVTRTRDGAVFRVIGEIENDGITMRLALGNPKSL